MGARLVPRLLFCLFASLLALPAAAQTYPSQPIRLIAPFPPGGSVDIMARLISEPLGAQLGGKIVIDNRSGASGNIGMEAAARAKPDGYTIVLNTIPLATNQALFDKLNWDPVKDFAPIGMVSSSPMVVVVNGDVPANDLKSFIEYARKNRGKLEYATAGPGSFGHLASELFLRAAGLEMVHVPYKGQGPTVNAVLAGEVKLLITSPSSTMNSHIASGKLKLLGVGTAERWPLAPETPTVSSVLPGYRAESWFALLAPAGTAPDVVSRLNKALNNALAMQDIQNRLNNFGLMAVSSSPQQLRERIAEEVKLWGTVIRESGIKID